MCRLGGELGEAFVGSKGSPSFLGGSAHGRPGSRDPAVCISNSRCDPILLGSQHLSSLLLQKDN
eukprot:7953465-Alexandrium_andersonii.AAC.1